MNILQIISNLDTSDAAEDVISSTKFLTLNGHKIVVVSEGGKHVSEIDEVGARHYEIPLKSNIFLIPFSIFKLSRIISKENVQIVHARCPLSSFVAFFASRFTDCQIVSTIYGRNLKGLFGRSQGWAKRVILFSATEAHHLVNNGFVSQHRVRVILPFVDVGAGQFYPRGGKISTPGVEYGQYFKIGAALPLASLETTQNFIRAVSILSLTIHKIKVIVLDSAPPNYVRDHLESLKLLIKRRSLSDIVVPLPSGKSGRLPAGLDLFAQVNVDENASRRLLLQAQASGVPVVTTRAGWLENYRKDGKKIFSICQTDSPNDLSSAILDLYKNEELKNKMINEAREFVKENFNQKKTMESLLDLYQETIFSKNILIIKIGALGDVILAVPSLRAIRQKFPKSKITVLVGMDNREVLANSPYIDEIMVYDWKERDRRLLGLLTVAKKLRFENFDMAIDFQNNKTSHLLSFLSCAPKRYGYDNGKLGFLLNRKVKDKKIPMDPIEHQSKVLNLLGIFNVDKRLELWPSEEDEKWADNFMRSHWINGKNRVIAINIGSSPRWVTKLWPTEYFIEVCNKLAKEFGIRSLLIGLKDEGQRAEEFLKDAKCKPIDTRGKTSIPRLASLIKRCSLLLSSDSAPIHVAAGVGTPCIALFGPTDPNRHLAPAENFIVFKKDLKCSPCYRTYCDRGYECMKSITPDEIYEAVVKLLGITNR